MLDAVYLIEITPAIPARAAAAEPAALRSLDAIHLATALSIDDPALDIITYDRRFAEAASASGLRVVQPGCGSGRGREARRLQSLASHPADCDGVVSSAAIRITLPAARSALSDQRNLLHEIFVQHAHQPAYLLVAVANFLPQCGEREAFATLARMAATCCSSFAYRSKLRVHLAAELRNLRYEVCHTRRKPLRLAHSLLQRIYPDVKTLRRSISSPTSLANAARELQGRVRQARAADVTPSGDDGSIVDGRRQSSGACAGRM